MIKSIYKIAVYFLIFVTLQVLVLNQIHLFKVAIPFLYLYVIVNIPANISRSQVILIAFFLGVVIDVFSNTLGLHTAACAFAGMFRDPIMYSFSGKELLEEASPSYRTMGVNAFMKYVLLLVAIHHIALFCIESVSLFDPLFLILRIVISVILTVLLIFMVEAFNIERKGGDS